MVRKVAAYIPERDFQDTVVALARLYGWSVYYIPDSRRSPEGYPDLTLARKGVVWHWELKSQKGRVSPAQDRWLAALGPTGHLFRPSDLDRIEDLLK